MVAVLPQQSEGSESGQPDPEALKAKGVPPNEKSNG